MSNVNLQLEISIKFRLVGCLRQLVMNASHESDALPQNLGRINYTNERTN